MTPSRLRIPWQDDYDIWLGTVTLDKWIPWNRHGTSNVLYLDGHAKSVLKPEAYLGLYPGGISHVSKLVSMSDNLDSIQATRDRVKDETTPLSSARRSAGSDRRPVRR